MTPSQLDHLRILDAHLDRLLETAKTRTPGRWKVNEHSWQDSSIWSPSTGKTTAILSIEDDEESAEDEGLLRDANAAYIASCAGNAEAGWKSTQRIIKEAIFLESDAPQKMSSILKILLEEWPIELITKHQ